MLTLTHSYASASPSIEEPAMPSRTLLRGFLALWITTALVLLIASVQTVRAAWPGLGHANPHLILLGTIEALAAVLFVIPRAMRWGAGVLLATIALAFTVHGILGQFRGDLLVYAVAVCFVLVHGPLTTAQWRAAIAGRDVTQRRRSG